MKYTTRTALLLTLLSTPAFAYSSQGGEFDHLLTVGQGISSPSNVSAMGENPAGLVFTRGFTLLGQVASNNDQLSPLGYGGGFLAGNGSVGAGVVLTGSNTTTNGVASALNVLDFGLAAEIPKLDIAFGFSGSFALPNAGNSPTIGFGNSSWGLDTGIIINPHAQTRFGLTLFNVINGVDAIGGGVSYDATPSATFTLDANYARVPQTTIVKPGLAIHLQSLQLSGGYGFRAQGTGSGWEPTGFSLGLGFPIGKTFALQGYYNQINLYYAGLTINL